MSSFFKLTYELVAQVIYNIVDWIYKFIQGFIHVFFTGWIEYASIFMSYFVDFGIIGKILAIILAIILIAIPVLLIYVLGKRIILYIQLKADDQDNETLYREIGRLNKQVLDLIDEKNQILALKVNQMGAGERIPYSGTDALVGEKVMVAQAQAAPIESVGTNRFPKLTLVDEKYVTYQRPNFDEEITLEQVVDSYRRFACSQMHLYYTPEIIRRFVAGMASSKLLILEGISGTGKTSLPYSFSRFVNNPATIISVQPSYRDRTELLGYFNEFSKKFNETEFLRALYEAGYREDPNLIVLDEMNLARIEYYFAEMLSVLEMPSHDEWQLDLVPTSWESDPAKILDGKIKVPDNIWFIGTANNDDSTFTITDKVYDRAMPIELNERADAFECEPCTRLDIRAEHLQELFAKAKEQYPISPESIDKLNRLDQYLQTRFKLAFGNRITKQMHDFIPIYVACGGDELGGLDYIIARKVLKKFESMNVSFVRDEIGGLIQYIEKLFGRSAMPDSKSYLNRIQNLY